MEPNTPNQAPIPAQSPTNPEPQTPSPPSVPELQLPTPKGRSKNTLIIAIVLVALIVAAVVAFLVMKSPDTPEKQSAPTTSKTETPVRDLGWLPPSSPRAGWTKQPASRGEMLWRFKDTSCTAFFNQPDGMTAHGVTTTAQVLNDAITFVGTGLGATPSSVQTTAKNSIAFDTIGSAAIKSVKFDAKEAYFPNQNAKSLAAAYLNGDFALTTIFSCNTNDYKAYAAGEMLLFATSFKVNMVE